VYRVLQVLSALVVGLPIGTNLDVFTLLWLVCSGGLLDSRGAVIPGLSALGLDLAAVQRTWAAVGHGAWTSAQLLGWWGAIVRDEGRWQPHTYAGYHPVAVDVTAFWRPRLRDCPTVHYHATAGRALPAIPVGIIARVGSVAGGASGAAQRFGIPLAFVRAAADDPRPSVHQHQLVVAAVAQCAPEEVPVFDAGFPVRQLQAAECAVYVVRVPKNFTARRAQPPVYSGRGRPPTRGALVRPLARRRGQRTIAATPPDAVTTWHEGDTLVRAERWHDLVLPIAATGAAAAASRSRFSVVAIHDPSYAEPLLLATPLDISSQAVRGLYRDRWPVEQIPLVAKVLLGAARQFVSAPETTQRLPELALLAGAVLTYAAATGPAVPTGNWDRAPQRTAGRLRRVLRRTLLPSLDGLPERLRKKAAATAHLPKGFFGQRHPRSAPPLKEVA
jgi:hypothetical protein